MGRQRLPYIGSALTAQEAIDFYARDPDVPAATSGTEADHFQDAGPDELVDTPNRAAKALRSLIPRQCTSLYHIDYLL